jgi:GntR family transcriptional regulator
MAGQARYRAIAADLSERIRSGQYPPGQALPGQRELSVQYGVTVMTLRQALQELQEQGLISQQPGRGTFVTPTQAGYRLDTLRSLADDLREQGHEVSTEIIGTMVRKPRDVELPDVFGVPGRALRVERLRLVNGRPAVHQVSWVSPVFAVRLAKVDLHATSLYAGLAELGVSVARATETIRLSTVSFTAARRLRQPKGTPVFESVRITYALDETVVLVDQASILGDVMEIRAERSARALSLNWTPAAR